MKTIYLTLISLAAFAIVACGGGDKNQPVLPPPGGPIVCQQLRPVTIQPVPYGNQNGNYNGYNQNYNSNQTPNFNPNSPQQYNNQNPNLQYAQGGAGTYMDDAGIRYTQQSSGQYRNLNTGQVIVCTSGVGVGLSPECVTAQRQGAIIGPDGYVVWNGVRILCQGGGQAYCQPGIDTSRCPYGGPTLTNNYHTPPNGYNYGYSTGYYPSRPVYYGPNGNAGYIGVQGGSGPRGTVYGGSVGGSYGNGNSGGSFGVNFGGGQPY